MDIIKRNGYGSNFNIIYLNKNNNIIIKNTINEYGINKLKYEIGFYNFIINNKINFNIPHIYEYNFNSIKMKYIQQDKYNIDYFNIIIECLYNLHNYNNINTNKLYYKKILFEETIYKIQDRYNYIKDIINNSNLNILFVNNIKLIKFDIIINKLIDIFNNYIDKNNIYILQPIHGDPQYNNIIFNKTNIYFIDPKGYFGSSNIYGIKEYDIAKIFFSLSGYEHFDDMIFNNIDIHNNNLNIPFINIPDFNIFNNKDYNLDLIKYLFITIWLSNSHIFIKQPYKVIYSFYIGIYFSSLLL
jgi:hypothetical protein